MVSYPEKENKTKKVVSVENNKEKAFSLENVLFITGYSYLTRKSKKVLDDVAEIIKKETFSLLFRDMYAAQMEQLTPLIKKLIKEIFQ